MFEFKTAALSPRGIYNQLYYGLSIVRADIPSQYAQDDAMDKLIQRSVKCLEQLNGACLLCWKQNPTATSHHSTWKCSSYPNKGQDRYWKSKTIRSGQQDQKGYCYGCFLDQDLKILHPNERKTQGSLPERFGCEYGDLAGDLAWIVRNDPEMLQSLSCHIGHSQILTPEAFDSWLKVRLNQDKRWRNIGIELVIWFYNEFKAKGTYSI